MLLRSLAIIPLLLLAACEGTLIPSKQTLPTVRHVNVVAMEAPPLDLPYRYLPASARGTAGTGMLTVQAVGTSMGLVQTVGVINTILVVVQLADSTPRDKEALAASEQMLDAEGVWTPTVALAEEAARQLSAAGVEATVAAGVKPIPGVTYRGVTVTMQNWLHPIQAYYHYNGPVKSYHVLANDPSAYVLEVGIANYEIANDRLLLEVHLKLIDPRSEMVIGRTKALNAFNMPRVETVDDVFDNDAAKFKEIFRKEGERMVKQCLAQMGLVASAQ